ncbi:HNH endonuclease [Nitratireductor sp. L1-7-SE]|uniref:HNH endonuclease n=1 Tax=Nitratireductor rhodophyticola TaxID=2854036 RepID=A0ABS7R996_9HYPH|nr:HNH endonuclease [Nitratireductor rhodophyticola]MBY8917229.1 HNH endonuclease [Nitratireductor rhodophyticola]MBY8920342.1 HNH endonuclease [Nitratireductor rhodophyticola]
MKNYKEFDWHRFRAYSVFDEFLKAVIIDKKSYTTNHKQKLELDEAFEEIHSCFVEGYDESKKDFTSKIVDQFSNASVNSKIVFANVEFLWAMPVGNISRDTKRSYAMRWFDGSEVVSGEQYFFSSGPDAIAMPGQWYLLNKYWELIALLSVLSRLSSEEGIVDVASAKKRVAELSYSAIYAGTAKEGRFSVERVCGVHSALLHLSDPSRYESIISENHKQQITKVFEHIIADRPDIICREEKIRLIRARLYEKYGDEGDPDYKYRWFFYLDQVRSLWNDKKGATQQLIASIEDEIHIEQLAQDFSEDEGEKEETKGYLIKRSARLSSEAKKRDKFSCRACNFSFKKKIVHVHHLDPLSERKHPKRTTIEDLVTLCPNCHYIAHFWLRKSNKYKDLGELLRKLQ